MKTQVGDIRREELFGEDHEGLHTKDDIRWRGYFGFSHDDHEVKFFTTKKCEPMNEEECSYIK
jgi:hypothetical protein